jgi:hypothetical protein
MVDIVEHYMPDYPELADMRLEFPRNIQIFELFEIIGASDSVRRDELGLTRCTISLYYRVVASSPT